MLHIMLALNSIPDVIKLLKVNQALQPISFGEAVDESRAMFEYSTDEIACHADVQDAVAPVRQYVDVSTRHAEILQDVDGRDKPGHDEWRQVYQAGCA
jgi:hypothetical protein